MKKIKTFYKALLILIVISSCKDETNLEFLNDVALPSNIGVNFIVTQDNTGLATITPFAEGATSFSLDFGDGSESVSFANGENVQHVYAEGTYTVGVVASNLIGETAEITQELVMSFQAPRNLEVSIENDVAVSRKVNITATAEFAATFEFHSGEDGIEQPVATGNIGDQISYDYETPGVYAVKVVAKGGAIETTEYTNLLTNGNFENGSEAWIVGVDDSSPAPVVTEGGNTYYSVNVEAAGNVYDVNLSQKVEIIGGNSYTLTFDAWSDTNRSIVAGIGLSGPPWTNTGAPLDITTTRTTYTFTYTDVGFEAPDARVLFDIGGEVGLVNIDDVTLSLN